MNLTEGKALLSGVQDFVVAQQAGEELGQRRACPHCGRRYTSKDPGSIPVSTVFGRVEVPNPRWKRCGCQTEGPKTFRPMRTWLNGRTSPEMLYLETKWASLIPFARTTDLLKEVLPVANSVNPETVRNHLQLTAERIEQQLGDWFHITMRLTVLQQQTKAMQEERPETGAEVSKRLESVKHLLWHGNTEEALERLGDLLMELTLVQARSNAAKKLVDGLDEFRTYICNNSEFIPNFGERRRQGETIRRHRFV
jgi:hypothetical protein